MYLVGEKMTKTVIVMFDPKYQQTIVKFGKREYVNFSPASLKRLHRVCECKLAIGNYYRLEYKE